MEMNKKISELAQQALDIQNSNNLSEVIRSCWEAIRALREFNLTQTQINNHPVIVLHGSKIASLTHADNNTFFRAYEECKFLQENET